MATITQPARETPIADRLAQLARETRDGIIARDQADRAARTRAFWAWLERESA